MALSSLPMGSAAPPSLESPMKGAKIEERVQRLPCKTDRRDRYRDQMRGDRGSGTDKRAVPQPPRSRVASGPLGQAVRCGALTDVLPDLRAPAIPNLTHDTRDRRPIGVEGAGIERLRTTPAETAVQVLRS